MSVLTLYAAGVFRNFRKHFLGVGEAHVAGNAAGYYGDVLACRMVFFLIRGAEDE